MQKDILTRITPNGLDSRPQLGDTEQDAVVFQSPYAFSCAFYGLEKPSPSRTRARSDVPFIAVFEDLVEINLYAARALLQRADDQALIREVLVQSLSLMVLLVERLEASNKEPLSINWNSAEWSSAMMRCLNHEVSVG